MTTINDIEVAIERRDDGRHIALIDGEAVAKLSPYRRSGYASITSWRVVNVATNRVDESDIPPGNDERNVNRLTEAARRIWFNRQPEEIERRARQRRESELKVARQNVEYHEKHLAHAKAWLAKLENQ